jgi:hypothetical protein
LNDRLILTEKTEDNCPILENCKVNKHIFLSNQLEAIRMAGEFQVYTDPRSKKIYIVFDNASGTYTPPLQKAQLLVELLRDTLQPDSRVEFIAKDREQVFNPVTLSIEYRGEDK